MPPFSLWVHYKAYRGGICSRHCFSITLCSLQLSPFPRRKSLEGLVPPLAYCSELGGSKTCVREISLLRDSAFYWEIQVAAPDLMWCTGVSKRCQNEDFGFIAVLSKCQIKPGKLNSSEMQAARKEICKRRNWWSRRSAGPVRAICRAWAQWLYMRNFSITRAWL